MLCVGKNSQRIWDPYRGFFIGFFGVQREDIFVEFDGQSYKVVCIDKSRIPLPAQNESQEHAEPVSDAPPDTSANKASPPEHTPVPQETLTVIPKEKNSD